VGKNLDTPIHMGSQKQHYIRKNIMINPYI